MKKGKKGFRRFHRRQLADEAPFERFDREFSRQHFRPRDFEVEGDEYYPSRRPLGERGDDPFSRADYRKRRSLAREADYSDED